MVTAVFDPERGTLRLDHAALSVLATLASRPTDPVLHDHAVAEVVSALRASRLLGPGGVHPGAAPLLEAVGRAHRTLDLNAVDHGVGRRLRLWIGSGLVVVALPAADATYDLMGDRAAAGGALIAEMVGLSPAPKPQVDGSAAVSMRQFIGLLTDGPAVVSPASVLREEASEQWIRALHDLAIGAAIHWTLSDAQAGTPLVHVVDAGNAGLWWATPAHRGEQRGDSAEYDGQDDLGYLAATTPREVTGYLDQIIRNQGS